jgi:hypothetical protein
MSANQSNLSGEGYGYHMVVATTQATVNNTLLEWLDDLQSQPFTQAYLLKDNESRPSIIDFNALKTELGFDPFTLDNNTPSFNTAVAKLQAKGFCCAFTTDLSFYPDFRPTDIPAIEFTSEGTDVTFNLLCKTFKIIALTRSSSGEPQWTNLSQQTNNPWVFNCKVPLGMHKSKLPKLLQSLPLPARQLIGDQNTDLFSIQRLVMNFSSASLINKKTIPGLEKQPRANELLTDFVQAFLKNISQRKEAVIGYSLVSDKPHDTGGSLVPTDVNFIISAYKDAQGKATKDYHAYTLNYLIMTGGVPMPPPRSFHWNWIEKDQTSKSGGVIAVNRYQFGAHLANLLSGSLAHVIKRIHVHIYFEGLSLHPSCAFETESKMPSYQLASPLEPGRPTLILAYNSKHENGTHYGLPGGSPVKFGLQYSPTLLVDFKDTSIVFTDSFSLHMTLTMGNAGKAEGPVLHHEVIRTYTIGVNNEGRLSITLSDTKIKSISDVVINEWAKALTRASLDSSIKILAARLKDSIEKFTNSNTEAVKSIMNGSQGWVFPGGKTFSFSKAGFSDARDLITHVLYVSSH